MLKLLLPKKCGQGLRRFRREGVTMDEKNEATSEEVTPNVEQTHTKYSVNSVGYQAKNSIIGGVSWMPH